ELLVIINVGFVAGAVDEPDLLAVAAVNTSARAVLRWKERPGKSAHRRDASAGGHQDGIGNGFLEDEVAVRAVNLDGGSDGQIGQIGEVIGEEALLDPVDAVLKAIGEIGRASCRERV